MGTKENLGPKRGGQNIYLNPPLRSGVNTSKDSPNTRAQDPSQYVGVEGLGNPRPVVSGGRQPKYILALSHFAADLKRLNGRLAKLSGFAKALGTKEFVVHLFWKILEQNRRLRRIKPPPASRRPR